MSLCLTNGIRKLIHWKFGREIDHVDMRTIDVGQIVNYDPLCR